MSPSRSPSPSYHSRERGSRQASHKRPRSARAPVPTRTGLSSPSQSRDATPVLSESPQKSPFEDSLPPARATTPQLAGIEVMPSYQESSSLSSLCWPNPALAPRPCSSGANGKAFSSFETCFHETRHPTGQAPSFAHHALALHLLREYSYSQIGYWVRSPDGYAIMTGCEEDS